MFDRVNLGLDVVLKTLSLSFTACMFLGVAVILVYLNGLGLGSEISATIGSPQILLIVAIYSVAISFCIIATLMLIPSLIKMAEHGSDLIWRNHSPRNKGWHYFFFVFSPFPIYVYMACMGASQEYFFIVFVLLCLSFSLRFYHFHRGPAVSHSREKVRYFLTTLMSLSSVLALLFLPIIFFIKAAEFLSDGEIFQWLILFFMILLYSSAVSFATLNQGYSAYFPVVVFSVLLLIFLFSGSVSKNIVIRSGLGGYEKTYSIDAKNLALIRESSLYEIKDDRDGATILKGVWVLLSLPDKLIISPSKESRVMHMLPSSAVLASTGEIDKGNQIKNKK